MTTSVSAKNSGFKAGAEIGLGLDTFKHTSKSSVSSSSGSSSSTTKTYLKNSGFAINLRGEYAFDENWAVKLDAGMMFAGKATVTTKTGSDSTSYGTSERSGIHFDVALDGKYTASINKELSISAFGGFKMIAGNVYKSGNEDTDKNYENIAFGLNFGGELSYAVNKKVSLFLGCDFAWLFVNNCEAFQEGSSSGSIFGIKASSDVGNATLALRPYVGAAYAF